MQTLTVRIGRLKYSVAERVLRVHRGEDPQRRPQQRAAAVALAEQLQAEDEPYASEAAAACLVEYQLKQTPTLFNHACYVPLQGEQSRAYARAWDKFTGVGIRGL